MANNALTHNRNTKAYWVTSIANPDAPTVLEMAAGTPLTNLTSDGVTPTHVRNNASVNMLDDAFRPEYVDTYGVAWSLKFTRQTGTDNMWDLFDTAGKAGHLVISRFGDGLTAGDEVEVYTAEAHLPQPVGTADGEMQQFEVQLAINAQSDRAVVAA